MILWYAGSHFPLGIGEQGFLVSDQSRNFFSFPIVGIVRVSNFLTLWLCWEPFYFFLLCLKMKKEVLAIENSPSAKNYDCKQLEGESHSGAILAFCKHGYKNKVPLWACLVITLGLKMKTRKTISET